MYCSEINDFFFAGKDIDEWKCKPKSYYQYEEENFQLFIYAKYFVTGILYRKKANSYLYTQDRQKVQES